MWFGNFTLFWDSRKSGHRVQPPIPSGYGTRLKSKIYSRTLPSYIRPYGCAHWQGKKCWDSALNTIIHSRASTKGRNLSSVPARRFLKPVFIRVHFVLRPARSYILGIFWYFLGPSWLHAPLLCITSWIGTVTWCETDVWVHSFFSLHPIHDVEIAHLVIVGRTNPSGHITVVDLRYQSEFLECKKFQIIPNYSN